MNRQEIIDKWNGMTDRERDGWNAEALGYTWDVVPPDCNGEYGGTKILVPPSIDPKTYEYPHKGAISPYFFVPPYTTDWNHAGEFFEEMTSTPKGVNLILWRDDSLNGFAIDELLLLEYDSGECSRKKFIVQPTPQRAICLAYLLNKLEAEDKP